MRRSSGESGRDKANVNNTVRWSVSFIFLFVFPTSFYIFFFFFSGAVYRMIAVLCGPSDIMLFIQCNFFHSLSSDVMFFFTRYYPTLLFIDFLLHYS